MGWTMSDRQETRIAGIHARLKAHKVAVDEGRAKYGDEPEMAEYLARWEAFVREMDKLGEREHATFSWITDDELDVANGDLSVLLAQWPAVGYKIELHKRAALNKLVQAAVDSSAAKENAGTAVGPAPGQAPTVVHLPDVAVDLPQSTATAPPPPEGAPPPKKPGGPDPYLAVKVGALGALVLGTAAGALAAGSGAGRVAVAGGGAALTLGAGLAMVWPDAPAPKEKNA